jgi:hypothetical protein
MFQFKASSGFSRETESVSAEWSEAVLSRGWLAGWLAGSSLVRPATDRSAMPLFRSGRAATVRSTSVLAG